jgi:hypothetical protein
MVFTVSAAELSVGLASVGPHRTRRGVILESMLLYQLARRQPLSLT